MSIVQTEQRLKNLLTAVAQQEASDLHLSVGHHPTLRIDGKLLPLSQEKVLAHDDIKQLADILIGSKQKKEELMQEGHVDLSYNFEGKARFRVNVFFQTGNLSVAMRLVPNKIRTIEELNLPPSLYDFTQHSQGLVLVTGPIGHGKSTTLAAMVDHINHQRDAHIITIEDPIEFMYKADRCIIDQREVGQDVKSFHSALRAVFREDANVVLIGEMRDLETISTTITAAEIGHLIFATLHTNDAAQTIDRIIDAFPAYHQNQVRIQLANVLLGVVSLRLIPREGGGRIPALELMIKNNAVENLVRENKTFQIDSVIETSYNQGMISLDRSLAELVTSGEVSREHALTHAKSQESLITLLDGHR